MTDLTAYGVISAWESEMAAAANASTLRVVKEKEEVMWLSTELKDAYEGTLLKAANDEVIRYCYGKDDKSKYLETVTTGQWPKVLSEVNRKLGYEQ